MFRFSRETVTRLAIFAIGAVALTISGLAFADTYTYDTSGRLVSVTYSNGSTVIYTYDAAGNRTALSQTP